MRVRAIPAVIALLWAPGYALAQYSYSPPPAYNEQPPPSPARSAFFPMLNGVTMRSIEETRSELALRLKNAQQAEPPPADWTRLERRFEGAGLLKAVNCGRVTTYYAEGMMPGLAGMEMPAASRETTFLDWRPGGSMATVRTEASVTAIVTLSLSQMAGDTATRIALAVRYTVYRSLKIGDGEKQEVEIVFNADAVGEPSMMTPYSAMHPVGFAVAPTGRSANAAPFGQIKCMSAGVLEGALLLVSAAPKDDEKCVLGLLSGTDAKCQ
ncbi:hypothetical protein [Elioraea sp.]|uniref:hypothetical protein n=1 Tax=Elioraea sp. TaxID=2185103 RepID=UPI003F7030AB